MWSWQERGKGSGVLKEVDLRWNTITMDLVGSQFERMISFNQIMAWALSLSGIVLVSVLCPLIHTESAWNCGGSHHVFFLKLINNFR
jgi:hypothetical protein